MATYNELIYDIMEGIRSNKLSDDTNISELNVGFHISVQRALWIRNEYNKPGRTIDPQVMQSINCLKLIPVDAAECCSVDLDCYVLRTERKIPKLIELHSGAALTRVSPINITLPKFNLTTQEQAVNGTSNKYTKNSIYIFFSNGYLYLMTANTAMQNLEYISIKGVFDNPLDLAEFKCDNGNNCFSLDDDYPLSLWMFAYIREKVMQQLGIPLNIPMDSTNDAKEDLTKQ